MRLYDLPTGTQLGEPIAGPIATGQVALRPDGGELAVPSDGGALVMNLEPEQHVRAECLLAGRRLTEQERTTYLRGLDPPPSCAS